MRELTPTLRRILISLPVLLLLAPLAARAADKDDEGDPKLTLKVGDPAPKLFVSKWLKGEPVKEFEKGKVYVIECWATWCGPCRASIPHVTELQAKYKDKGVTIIGMNVWERDLALPEPFVKEMGKRMEYTVALDEVPADAVRSTGNTAKAWLAAAGRNGIPCSFIVDKEGKIAWIGHPMSMERPLSRVADGKFDPKEQEEFDGKVQELQKKLSEAAQATEYDKAMALMDELAVLDPTKVDQVAMMKLSLLLEKDDYAAANAAATKLADGALKDKPAMQGQIALMLMRSQDPEKADADLAIKMVERALAEAPTEVRFQKAAALAYAQKKQFAKAAEWQGKLIDQLKGRVGPEEASLLDEYKAKAAAK